jgi:hypothetical protein
MWWNKNWQGKPKYSEETCPSAILSITNATLLDLVSNTNRRGGKPVTNRLSYGKAVDGPNRSCPAPYSPAIMTGRRPGLNRRKKTSEV